MLPAFALLDAPEGGAWLFEKLSTTLVVSSAADFAGLCREAEQRAQAGEHVVAALDYELGHVFEPRSGTLPDTPLGHFWAFSERRLLSRAAVEQYLAALGGNPLRPATVAAFSPEVDAGTHARAVRRIRDYIAAGDCYQVNFTFPFSGQCLGDPVALYARLRKAQPVAHGGLVVTPEACILSLSPELFVERSRGAIRARPMKGTAARCPEAAADAAACAALGESPKDRAENVMIVDLIRNDLGRISVPGSVRVESLCHIEAFPSVFQMTSSVVARSDADLSSVLAALFPCGSVTGAPKVRAMQIVGELETRPRGLYTGALGWIGAGGDFSFGVAIRTLQIDPAGHVRYGVGSGIVWDSEAAAEYAECLLKARFVTQADPGFRLIETMRLAEGELSLLNLHLDRLEKSAAVLAFVFDRPAITARLRALAGAHAAGTHRVRLTLGRAGDAEIVVAPLAATGFGRQIALSSCRLQSQDPWLRHKTTVRDLYERELARISAEPESEAGQETPPLFDVIFLNERDEVCEGARSNIFVRRIAGGALLTPPLSCGLLPGVLRRQLLESGEAAEAILYATDLFNAAELYVGNALRGLIRVSLAAS